MSSFSLTKKQLAIIKHDYEAIDPLMPVMLKILRERRADECFHKHGTFLDHLLGVWKIMVLWGMPQFLCRCALFHSAYGNGRVNLSIFDSLNERDWMKETLGAEAEEWTYMFCTINRRKIVDYVMLEMLESGQHIPGEGLVVPCVGLNRPEKEMLLSHRQLRGVVVLTMADFVDQNHGYQDRLFRHEEEGVFLFSGENPHTLWPGDGRPGLWVNFMSRMALLLSALRPDASERVEDRIPTPPCLEHCSAPSVSFADDVAAVRGYAKVMTDLCDPDAHEEAEAELRLVSEKNPYVGEPLLALAQIKMAQKKFEEVPPLARRALTLLLEWGAQWDKRMTWEGWIAWGRLLLQHAEKKEWPETSWGIVALGLVEKNNVK